MDLHTPIRVIEGTDVDVLSPFPIKYLERLIKWTHQYKSLISHDFTPTDDESLAKVFANHIQNQLSYAVVDKYNKIGLPTDGPIVVGGFFVEDGTPTNLYTHVVSQRRVWGKGLMDEGASLVIKDLFEIYPDLQRLSAYMVSNNRAVINFVEKQGFVRDGLFRDMTIIKGEPKDVAHYGLTRRRYNEIIKPPDNGVEES